LILRRSNTTILILFCLFWAGPSLWAGKGETPSKKNVHLGPQARADSNSIPVHVVKQGDTLYDIALANHLNVSGLKETNRLKSHRLRIGQRLLLAAPSGPQLRKKKSVLDNSEVAAVKTSGVGLEVDDPASTSNTADRPVNISGWEGINPGQPTLRAQLVQAGLGFLGVPYRWNGMSEHRGVDCSGLVKNLFDKLNIEVPRSSREQFKIGEKVAKAELAVGDLVFFSTRGKIPSHVGIYIGDNQFIHAARRARQVIISNLSQAWYQKRFIGARRISDLWKDEQKPSEAKGN
jgi:cell wall-associated NlpC family hydrolase